MKKAKLKVAAVIPAYNEEKRLHKVIKEVSPYVDSIIVIDDGSTDNTSKFASGRKVVLLQHILNLGQGAALETGFEYARRNNFGALITFDADGQFRASQIPRILAPIINNKADITLGSRFLGKSINMPTSKKVLLKLAVWFTKLYSNIELTDTHNGFRGLNKKALEKIHLTQNRMSHASEIIQQIKLLDLKFKEVPVTVIYDNYSKNKGQKLTGAINIFIDLTLKKIFQL